LLFLLIQPEGFYGQINELKDFFRKNLIEPIYFLNERAHLKLISQNDIIGASILLIMVQW